MQKLSDFELQQLFQQALPRQPLPPELRQRLHQRVQQELRHVQGQVKLQQSGYYSPQQLINRATDAEFGHQLLARFILGPHYILSL